jgi:hypothetical protein
VTEAWVLIIFTCENCGKQFQVDERSGGKRGRCSHCGHVMRIPNTAAAPETPSGPTAEPATAPEEAPFRLSPPESRPWIHRDLPPPDSEPALPRLDVAPHGSIFGLAGSPAHEPFHQDEFPSHFELLDDDDPGSIGGVSPEVQRGLKEMAEFEKDRGAYNLVSGRRGFFRRVDRSRPAGWFYVKWRGAVGTQLKLLRLIDSSAYLISVLFLMLMLFGIIVGNPGFMHTGAVVVVLANYGRFWTDLLALFVRPYKDGPLQGVAFLFPPYTVYYLTRHWDRVKPIVRRIATSCIPIVLVVLAYAFLPLERSSVKDLNDIPGRIKAGEQELRRDIDSELRNVEGEVRSLGKKQAP